MVQKWAIGAMINMSGSIAINLGTNLMKLSHKMEKGDPQQQQPDNNGDRHAFRAARKPSAPMSPSDLEAAEPMITNSSVSPARRRQQPQQQYFPSTSKGSGSNKARRAHGVEMTAYSAVSVAEDAKPGNSSSSSSSSARQHASGSEPARQGGGGGGGGRGRIGVGVGVYAEEETVGLTEESSPTDSPSSSGAGVSTSSDDHRAEAAGLLLGKPVRPAAVLLASRPPPRGRRSGGAPPSFSSSSSPPFSHGTAVTTAANGRAGGEYDEHDHHHHHHHPGVRRRAPSSPRQDLLEASGSGGSGGSGGEGFSGRTLLESGGVGGVGGAAGGGDGAWEQQFEWKTKVLWYLGAVLLVGGSLVNFASFGFAPQSLLASLGSVQFISNVVFGKVILREIVTRRIIVGTATIILGNTLTLCFSPHQDDTFSTQQLKAFYDLEYNTLLCLELASALAMHATYKRYKRSKERGKPRRHSDLVMPLAYAICSAIIGTQSVVNAKCLSELLTLTFQGENQMGSPFTYLVMAIWLGTTIFWLVRMNRALAMFHGLFIIPALQVFWTFFSVIGGGFYFEEFHTLHVLGGLGFAVGVLVVFCGVYLLAPRTQTDHGRRAGAGTGDDGVGSDVEPSDLTRMLRLDDESPATSPAFGGVRASLSAGQSPALSMEAGDEEIDWDHTRMLSLGFFPSISTDQDVAKMGMGKLANSSFEGIHDAEAGDTHDHSQAGGGARVTDASRRQRTLRSPPWSKPKNTPPRSNSPNRHGRTGVSPFGAAAASEEAGSGGGGGTDGDNEAGDRAWETERRRRRAGGAGGAAAAAAAEADGRGGGGGGGGAERGLATESSSSHLAPR